MDDSFKKQQENPGPLGQTSTGADIDEFKRMLIDTNPVLLATTFIVRKIWICWRRCPCCTAFSSSWPLKMVSSQAIGPNYSDISHWRSKKDNTGVSFRTILSNVVMQTIIFLVLYPFKFR